MKNKFASLVGMAMEGLENNSKTVKDLIVLLEGCDTSERGDNTLIKDLEKLIKEGDIKDAFRILHKYWSYFDYELLSTIINTWCKDLKPDLDNYISDFVNYCELRVCEVPSDSCGRELPKLDSKKRLYVKIDSTFLHEMQRIKLQDIKNLQSSLSELLCTSLFLLNVEDGCIKLTFHCLHEIDVLFPVSSKQGEDLQRLGVTMIYSENHHLYPIAERGILHYS